jgi:hypothetical protein
MKEQTLKTLQKARDTLEHTLILERHRLIARDKSLEIAMQAAMVQIELAIVIENE